MRRAAEGSPPGTTRHNRHPIEPRVARSARHARAPLRVSWRWRATSRAALDRPRLNRDPCPPPPPARGARSAARALPLLARGRLARPPDGRVRVRARRGDDRVRAARDAPRPRLPARRGTPRSSLRTRNTVVRGARRDRPIERTRNPRRTAPMSEAEPPPPPLARVPPLRVTLSPNRVSTAAAAAARVCLRRRRARSGASTATSRQRTSSGGP